MRLRSILLKAAIAGALSAPIPAFAVQQSASIPAWLTPYVGEAKGQIAAPVLQRARALYLQKLSSGVVRNPCYFAMDATRPNDGSRFYIICEATHSFRTMAAGHGSGRNLPGAANFANGRECAKNFGNALDSDLTTGGSYVTAETKTSFKGYYRVSATRDAPYLRSFIQFDGEGDTANARSRVIGGHAAAVLRAACMKRAPDSPYAKDGYVPFGQLVDYAGGRSNGCTSWSQSDINQILPMVNGRPTTLYIYPEAADINAVARSPGGAYWNASCLRTIGAPRFWTRQSLEPLIAQYKAAHPAPPPRPLPICQGQ